MPQDTPPTLEELQAQARRLLGEQLGMPAQGAASPEPDDSEAWEALRDLMPERWASLVALQATLLEAMAEVLLHIPRPVAHDEVVVKRSQLAWHLERSEWWWDQHKLGAYPPYIVESRAALRGDQ